MPSKSERFNDWKVIGIRAYYADYGIFSTQEEGLEDFPHDGVITFNFYFDQTYKGKNKLTPSRHKDTAAGDNFYWVDAANWRDYGTADRKNQIPAGKLVFDGQEVDKALFLEIYNRAYLDREF
jgi:hypothetical protein